VMAENPNTSDQETLPPCAEKKKRQRQNDHQGKKKHWCPTCNQGFTRLQGLKKHLGHFLFECEECNLIVKSKWNLDRHIRSHQGVKPFQCQVPECSRTFADKSALSKHMSKTHKKPLQRSTRKNSEEKYEKRKQKETLKNGDEKYGKNEVNKTPLSSSRLSSPSHLKMNQLTISSPTRPSTREFEQPSTGNQSDNKYGNVGMNLPTFSNIYFNNTGVDKFGSVNVKKEDDTNDIYSGWNIPEESYPKLTQHMSGQLINNELMASMQNESSLNSSNFSNSSLIETLATLRQLQGQFRPSTVWNLYRK